jgi:hypothetical protein
LSPRPSSGFRCNGLPVPVYSQIQDLCIHETDFFDSNPGRHSESGVWGGSQPGATPSLSAPLHLLLPERVVIIRNLWTDYTYIARTRQLEQITGSSEIHFACTDGYCQLVCCWWKRAVPASVVGTGRVVGKIEIDH